MAQRRSDRTSHWPKLLHSPRRLAARHRLGKYRVVRRIAEGGFATVYAAYDTIEGVHVALKVPNPHLLLPDALAQYRKEARLNAGLDHPNILPVKTAEVIEGRFVLVYPLGKGSLADRMRRRMTVDKILGYAAQMLEAVAYAHGKRIIHCDLKPENFILFDDDRIRLADFGIARVALRTVAGSGSGTVGYMAPEQAMGRASFRSDVFSLGLILYRMLSPTLPEWPFAWPPPDVEVVRRKVPEAFVEFLYRAFSVDQGRRFADARPMLKAFKRLEPRVRRFAKGGQRRRRGAGTKTNANANARGDWRSLRFKQFVRSFRGALRLDRECRRCSGPLAETMYHCPWCGNRQRFKRDDSTSFPARCPRCLRGRKLDWSSCAWCYGPGFAKVAERSYDDRRYTARCTIAGCGQALMPYMRYCPACRKKVRRPWRIEGASDRCRSCGWGVVPEFWSHCAWCGTAIEHKTH